MSNGTITDEQKDFLVMSRDTIQLMVTGMRALETVSWRDASVLKQKADSLLMFIEVLPDIEQAMYTQASVYNVIIFLLKSMKPDWELEIATSQAGFYKLFLKGFREFFEAVKNA